MSLFVGGTGSANELDDYEEGTWTPSTTEGMGTIFGAHYTKIGRLVTCQAYFNMPSSSDSGTTKIDGFPFTSIGSGHYGIGAAYSQFSGNNHIFMQMATNNSYANPYYGIGYGFSFATASGGYLLFSISYYTT